MYELNQGDTVVIQHVDVENELVTSIGWFLGACDESLHLTRDAQEDDDVIYGPAKRIDHEDVVSVRVVERDGFHQLSGTLLV